MSITVNNGGTLHELSEISCNVGGVLQSLDTVTANDGGVLRQIFCSSFVSFQEINTGNIVSGGLSSAEYVKGQRISVSFSQIVSKSMSNHYVLRIWLNNIKAGDRVVMRCSYVRGDKSYNITSCHYNADGTLASYNGLKDNGLWTGEKYVHQTYLVDYVAATNKGFIDILFGNSWSVDLTFNVDRLIINGSNIFGDVPIVEYSDDIRADSVAGVTYGNSGSGNYPKITSQCSASVRDATVRSQPFTWVDSAQHLYVSARGLVGTYEWHPPGAPDGVMSTSADGNASIVLVDEQNNRQTICSFNNYYSTEEKQKFYGEVDSSWLTVGQTYRIEVSCYGTASSPKTYGRANLEFALVY